MPLHEGFKMLHKNLTVEKNKQNYLKQLQGPITFFDM